ncbi:hypothetical protein JCM24511_03764 [Saitozyma sp. JCM 24511]|nr:hypothetical protein JCM24511_03764 [Saitozyma sp. JCM 24511]
MISSSEGMSPELGPPECRAITQVGPRPVDSGATLQSSLESDRPLPPHPAPDQTSRRNDIQVFSLLGSQATGLANAEYDLTVVSLANKDARATQLPNQDTDPYRLANKYLDSVADHKVRHRPTSNLPFHPIVLSLGGMMNGSTTKVFASWKRVMTRGTYNLMLKRLSLCLLQARVRSFEL